ncbi:MAG: KR domain-containing protein, partial [bacterium]
ALVGERFGELNGVIHAANTPGAGIIQLKTRETAAAVLVPKTKGTLVLASLTKDLQLDFFALFSSSVSIAGGFGQVDSCAANTFLDAFAHHRSVDDTGMTVSINWSSFQWDQWQMPAGAEGLQAQLQQNLQRNGISAGESMETFDQIISDTLRQVIVCPEDLASVMKKTEEFTVANFLAAMAKPPSAEAHPRPAIAIPYVAPRNEIEQMIAWVWQEAFGIAPVGVEDNFFELAGNSLLAIQIVTRLRRTFEVELPLTSLFDAPTISELAQRIGARRNPQLEIPGMEQILSEIEALSLDEAVKKFAEEKRASG